MSNKNQILFFTLIRYSTLFLGFARSILNARMLGPNLFGLLGTLLLILGYLTYSNLGIVYAMNREIVHCQKNNDSIRADKIYSTTLSFLIFTSILIISASLLAYLFNMTEFMFYLILISIVSSLDQFKNFFVNKFRLVNRINRINLIEGVYNVVSLLLLILVYSIGSIREILLIMIIADIFVLIYAAFQNGRFKFMIDFSTLKVLIILGVPLLVYNLMFYLLTTVDRLFILNFFTNLELGYYTFASQIVQATLVFISSILFLIYPTTLKKMDSKNDPIDIIKEYNNTTTTIETLGVTLIVFGTIVIYPFVIYTSPEYLASISSYNILAAGLLYNQLAFIPSSYLVSNKQINSLIVSQVITLLIAIIFNYLLLSYFGSLIWISIATLLTNIIYSRILLYLFYNKIGIKYERKIIEFVYQKFKLLIFIIYIFYISFFSNNLYINFILAIALIALYSKNIFKIAKRISSF